jgi:dTDP-4-dehydrorhamnose 3,5-epimerase
MKLLDVKALEFPEIRVIRFARFRDQRGYFTEHFRRNDLQTSALTPFMAEVEFVQGNESFSRAGTVRGLHFQWNPYMGKLVRTLRGHMVDLVLDIRKGSPTFGRIIAYDMPADLDADHSEWIWVPPGFAHGNFFLEDTSIEYLCSGEHSPGCEAGIAPLADDIDWSLCSEGLRDCFRKLTRDGMIISDKDKTALSLKEWERDARSQQFIF